MITLILLLIALLGLQPSLALPAVPPPPTPVQPTATPRARVMLMGDVMLARSVGDRIRREGPGAPFRRVKPILDRADLVIANLETVISKRGTRANKLYTFRARPKSVRALRKGGVDIVGLANNHTLDYGRTALRDTIRILDRAGIRSAGAGRDRTAARAPVIVTRNGLRIAFLDRADANLDSYEWPRLRWEATTKRSGLAYARPKQLREDVRAAKRRADVVIVMLHSGREYAKSPTNAQRRVVEAALDGGAALVVSAHPHVLQKGRHRGSTMVAWSLGNFVFDGFETIPGARDSAILDVTLTRQGVASVRWHPVIIRQGFPKPATGADRRRILRTLGVD
ncbi:MAG: CapA family protein [Chloroflexi bacterium]|nr:CapA family protein [Chloroflexota bacterium]